MVMSDFAKLSPPPFRRLFWEYLGDLCRVNKYTRTALSWFLCFEFVPFRHNDLAYWYYETVHNKVYSVDMRKNLKVLYPNSTIHTDIPRIRQGRLSAQVRYCSYTGKYSPSFYFHPFRHCCQWVNLTPGEFQYFIYHSLNRTLGDLKTERNCLQELKGENYTSENNPVYST